MSPATKLTAELPSEDEPAAGLLRVTVFEFLVTAYDIVDNDFSYALADGQILVFSELPRAPGNLATKSPALVTPELKLSS